MMCAPLLAAIALVLACSESAPQAEDPLVARGRKVYLAICTACHHGDPTRDGVQGPAVAGSSRELLEARVVRGEYPPGYTPKRPSQLMPPFPHLAEEMDALYAFLASGA